MTSTWEELGVEIPHGKHGNIKTLCPKCSRNRRNSREKCLSVNVEKGLLKCHHCGWAGSLDGKDWRDPILGRRHTPKPYRKPDPLPAEADLTPAALAFFEQRRISRSVVAANQITANAKAIRFPYLRGGETINAKYRGPGKRFWMEADCELIFWGLDHCAGAPQVVICEGEMDALSVQEAGVSAVLSVPNGATVNGDLSYLDSAAIIFATAHTVLLAVDNDGPGQWLEGELARRIGREKCFRVTWPAGCKDANDVLVQHGADELRRCLAEARPYPIAGIVHPADLMAEFLALYRNEQPRGVSTGWASVDELYTVKTGQLTIVTGSPGSGKSEWLDALMVNLAMRDGWSFAVYSPENFPPERHMQKWAEKYLGVPLKPGPRLHMTESEAVMAARWTNDHLAFLIPDEPSLDELLDLAEVQVFRHGAKGVVLDPWNEIEHCRPAHVTETDHISASLSKIRQFARHHDVHMWVIAHPTKLHKQDGDQEYPVATPYSIAGSAGWFNKADNCISVWRKRLVPTDPVEIHVQKIRFREIGKLGVALLDFDIPTGRYMDTGRTFNA